MMLGIAIWLLLVSSLVMAIRACAPPERRPAALAWGIAGVAAAVSKVGLLRATPQWNDVPVDATGHALHGQAFAQHLVGLPVDPILHQLHGYLVWWAPHLGPRWLPDAAVGYGGVLGSSEWLYAFTLGLWGLIGPDWETGAWLWNAALVGAMAGAAVALAGQLELPSRIGHWAAALLAVEPSLAVNAAWTLKDPTATCLATLSLALLCKLLKRPTPGTVLVLSLLIGMLGGVRYVGLLCLSGALAVVCAQLMWRGQLSVRLGAAAAAVALVTGMTWVTLYCAPLAPDPTCTRLALVKPLAAQATTFQASAGERGHDPTVQEWREEISSAPLVSGVRAVARTLLAPYPWVVWRPGLDWNNHIELYLPGAAVWMLLLPFALLGAARMTKRSIQDPRSLAFMVFLTLVASAYLVFFGEWSTRQRLFLQPLLMILIAVGIDRATLHRHWRSRPEALNH